MKRSILVTAALFLAAARVCALDVAGIAASSTGFFDNTFTEMLTSFYSYRETFYSIASTICYGIGAIGIFWHVLKIAFGNEDFQKGAVDSIMKIILYCLIMSVYPKAVDYALNLGTSIGLESTMQKLTEEFVAMSGEIEKQTTNALAALKNDITDGFQWTGITEKEIEKMAKSMGMDEEMAAKFNETIKSMDLTVYKGRGFWREEVATTSSTTAEKLEASMKNMLAKQTEYYKKIKTDPTIEPAVSTLSSNPGSDAYSRAVWDINAYITGKQEAAMEAFFVRGTDENGKDNGVSVRDCITRIHALMNTCMTDSDRQVAEARLSDALTTMSAVKISDLIKLNPYISDKNGNLILSPASIIKTASLVASLCNSETAAKINSTVAKVSEDENLLKRMFSVVKTSFVNFTYHHLLTFILDLIINIGVIACGVYFCVQYIMMLLEYYLVTAIGYILLPFIMWEISAGYTKNLVKLLVSYFFKIMVMCICMGWSWIQFLNLARFMVFPGSGSAMIWNDPWSLVTSVFFTLVICLAFTGEAPKIAQTLLTGNPDMSMGEFMKQATAVVGGARLGARVTKTAAKTAAGAGKGAIRAGAQVAGTFAGASAAESERKKNIKDAESRYASAQKNQAEKGRAVEAAKQKFASAQGEEARSEARKELSAARKAKAAADREELDAGENLNAAHRAPRTGYVGNALAGAVMDTAVKFVGLDRGAQEYKDGQWRQKTPTSKGGYLQYQRDKGRARADEVRSGYRITREEPPAQKPSGNAAAALGGSGGDRRTGQAGAARTGGGVSAGSSFVQKMSKPGGDGGSTDGGAG